MSKNEDNFAKKRELQLAELYLWGKNNTNLKKFSKIEAAKFFFSDRENVSHELVEIFTTFNELKSHAIQVFNVGNYVASEYAISIILKITKNFDIVKIFNDIQTETILIQPPMTNSGKFKLIQKTISKLNDKNLPSNENTVTEHLTQKEGFTEVIAKETIEKALKIGAITKNDLDELCL
tara:strand:+ start:261 stop:797 length:537 start_codon:yes stop_codon:yes gene_type:complete